jgi:gliding motility-associated lipoprotein GldH
MKKISLIFCALFFLVSCNENRIYNEHQDVTGSLTWLKDEKHVFKVNITDISVPYNIIVAVRHHSKASMNAIKITLTTTTPDKKQESKPYTIPLLDPQTGLPLGAAAGDISDKETIVKSNHKFETVGEYTFLIEPQDKTKDIGGIMEVGLVVDKIVPAE